MSKERRLGRGLAALLGTPDDGNEEVTVKQETSPTTIGSAAAGERPEKPGPKLHKPSASTVASPEKSVSTTQAGSTEKELLLSVSLIEENPFQPRREFNENEIASLAESLKEHDMLQPVLVRRIGSKYQLISGERRLRAARRAGWKKIPARVREADDRLVAELAIVENLKRKDLNAIEKALSFQRYLDEHNCTQDDLGNRLKMNRSTIANLLRLLELPPEVQRSLQNGDISQGHARALLPLGDRREQIQFCNQIKGDGLSVRAIEQLVSEAIGRDQPDGLNVVGTGKSSKKRTRSGQIASLEQDLKRALGTKVEIKTTARGGGKISISFKNHEEFERIQKMLMDETPQKRRRQARA